LVCAGLAPARVGFSVMRELYGRADEAG